MPKVKAVLTAEQQERKDFLESFQRRIEDLEMEYSDAVEACDHVMLPLTEEMKAELRRHTKKSWDYDSAGCEVCGTDFGWRCPESPDTVCHYFSVKRGGRFFVDLINSVEFVLPADHDDEYETEDSCLFCGAPNERK